jgi:hypothetical protein
MNKLMILLLAAVFVNPVFAEEVKSTEKVELNKPAEAATTSATAEASKTEVAPVVDDAKKVTEAVTEEAKKPTETATEEAKKVEPTAAAVADKPSVAKKVKHGVKKHRSSKPYTVVPEKQYTVVPAK